MSCSPWCEDTTTGQQAGDSNCAGTKPASSQSCNTQACPVEPPTSCPSGLISCNGSCVAPVCSSDSDCVVNGTCENPGTCGATCILTVCPEGQISCQGMCIAPEDCGIGNPNGGSSSLSVSFAANPSSGQAPLAVSLSASVSGISQGPARAGSFFSLLQNLLRPFAASAQTSPTVNYTFWWDCAYDGGGSPTVSAASAACGDPSDPARGAKFDGLSTLSKSAAHTYASAGTYRPMIIVEEGAGAVDAFASVSVSAPSNPSNPQNPGGTPPSCSMSVSRLRIRAGATSTVSWTCTDADSCSLSGFGPVPADGSRVVSPSRTTGYLLSCTNASTPTPAQAEVSVTVSQNPGVIEVNP